MPILGPAVPPDAMVFDAKGIDLEAIGVGHVPLGLTPSFWENPSRPTQVRAFARRAGLEVPATSAEDFTTLLHAFLAPVLDDLRRGATQNATWSAGGPWS